jgi:hypothetical protein
MLRRFRIALVTVVTVMPFLDAARADYPAGDVDRGLTPLQLQRVMPLAINEFMASNRGSVEDPQGQFDDWIELHNYGPDPIDIGGLYLTDDLSNPDKWLISGDGRTATTIPAGGYLVIWGRRYAD